jgi:Uncharacterized protein with conserved CXXC pairs
MADSKNITCTVCPIGCRLAVRIDDSGNITAIEGNTCKRGEKYATSEILNPVRTLTSTVKIDGKHDEKLLPVRTNLPIPKGKMFEAMVLIKNTKIDLPIQVGDVIIKDFIAEGINLIACKNIG